MMSGQEAAMASSRAKTTKEQPITIESLIGLTKKGIFVLSTVVILMGLATRATIASMTSVEMRMLLVSQVTFPTNVQQPEESVSSHTNTSSSSHVLLVHNMISNTTNHNSSSRADAEDAKEWTAGADNPREVVKTRPYNNKRVAYISYGSFKDGQERFQTMIIDSLRTWLKDNVIFYVMNKEWKTKFEEACNEATNRQECKRIVPIFVDCPEGYYGKSPCCKMDKGMAAMWEHYAHYDWYSYQDDDMYIRTKYMDDFLSGLSPDEPMVLTCKGTRQLGITWGDKKFHSNCSDDMDFRYSWGQPAMYSRAGLERMSKAFQLGAMTKQCQAFGVTHDVGNPIVHWMMVLPEVRLPAIPPRSSQVSANQMGTHAIARNGNPNATEVHAQIGHVMHPQPPFQYQWHKPKGFLQTTTYKLHGNVSGWSEWHTMNASDCRGPPVSLLAH